MKTGLAMPLRVCLLRGPLKILRPLFTSIFLLLAPAHALCAPQVAVSIVPQRYFVEQIAGGLVHVTVMVPPGANPATYEPRPSQMRELSMAQAYFAIGVPFERTWLKRFRAANPKMMVVDTVKDIRLYPISSNGRRAGMASQEIPDPHVWLAPALVLLQARNILNALVSLYPEHATVFRKRYRDFSSRLIGLDLSLMETLETGQKRKGRLRAFMVFHPSWGYFARAYGLKQVPIEQEGKEPRPSQLFGLIKRVKKLGIKVILVQPQFSQKAARIISEATGARIVKADPLAYRWDENLLEVAKTLRESWE